MIAIGVQPMVTAPSAAENLLNELFSQQTVCPELYRWVVEKQIGQESNTMTKLPLSTTANTNDGDRRTVEAHISAHRNEDANEAEDNVGFILVNFMNIIA